jgi:hypothetical protein
MKSITTLSFLVLCQFVWAQAVPAEEENIPFLVTFGKEADTSWGDDDFVQTFFFSIPFDQKEPFYIRVYDPDCSGQFDEQKGEFNTFTRFSFYGGQGCVSNDDSRSVDPVGNFKSGTLLASKTFGQRGDYDGQWYTFGPFNPVEGERSDKYGGQIFKMIAEGIRGDDGNLYRYFLSTDAEKNIPVEGGNAFTFEYTFRLHSDPWQTSHVYPYIDDEVLYLAQANFDWDTDGFIRIYSVVTFAEQLETSGDDHWSTSKYTVKDQERGKSLDIQFTKDSNQKVNNNNVVFYVTNQYGDLLPFYTVPIGGIPRYQGKAIARPVRK